MSDDVRSGARGPRWVCRSCEGGFPNPVKRGKRPVCPWCGTAIGKAINLSMTELKTDA